jgi:PKD repeat protein
MKITLNIFFLVVCNLLNAQSISVSNNSLNQIDTVKNASQKTTYTYDATGNIINKKIEAIANIDIVNNSLQLSTSVINNNVPFIASGSLHFSMLNSLTTCKLGFYLSTDNILDGTDIFLRDTTLNNTPSNATLNFNNLSLIISTNPTAGNYFVLSKIDYNNQITETNENNNVQSTAITIQNCSLFLVSITATAQPTCNLNNGSISITPTGLGFMYSLNQNNQYQASNTFSDLSAGNYTVYVKNPSGCISSSTINLTNSNGSLPISVFSYLQNGSLVNFTNLSQNATSYLWNFGNGVTSTQTNPTYTYPNSGNYVVTLSSINSCGTVTSQQNVNVVLNGCPSFVQINSNKTVNVIGSPDLVFSVANAANFSSIIWNDGVIGATRTIYNPGTYYVTATSGVCTYTSNQLIAEYACQYVPITALLVNGSPYFNDTTFSCNPTSVTLSLSNSATYYQWYKDSLLISGATNATYKATETGSYYCKMFNGNFNSGNICSVSTFNKFNLVVKPVVYTIGNATAPAIACTNSIFNVTLSTNNTPNGSFIELWESTNNNAFVYISGHGFNGGVLSIPINSSNIASTKRYFFRIVPIANSCSTIINTDTVATQIIEVSTPNVSISASQNNICAGTTVVFNATSQNTGLNPIYQWRVNGNNVGTNSNSFSYTPSNNDIVTVNMTSSLQCITATNVTSSPITMNVIPIIVPNDTIIVSANPICQGASALFTSITNITNPTYNWFRNGILVSTSTITNGYLGTFSNSELVYCVASSNSGCYTLPQVFSNVIALNVNPFVIPTISITSNDADNIVCKNQSVTFTSQITNGGLTPTIQWYKNGNLIATGLNYTTNTLIDNDKINCILVTSADCPTTNTLLSNMITVTVPFINPVITKSNFDLSTPNRLGSTFVWSLNNSVISGTNSNVYRVPIYGTYSITETYKTCSATSLPYDLQPNPNQVKDVSLFPNPFSENRVFVQTTSNVLIKQIVVTNTAGQIINSSYSSLNNNLVQIDFANKIASGVYFFKFITNNGEVTIKSVKL